MPFDRLFPLTKRVASDRLPVPRCLSEEITPTRRLSILGSTGSIGTQTLEVAREEGYEVVALAAGKNVTLLAEQIRAFKPHMVAVQDEATAKKLLELFQSENDDLPDIGVGREGLVRVACWEDADTVVAAITGFAGLEPVLAAARVGKKIALANKEALVVGGHAVMHLARESGALILPIDSEHSAIWQCLQGTHPEDLQQIVLTCSGGPFFGSTRETLDHVTVEQALAHPTWSMGNKITIDSATLMNKAFEVMEACHLYGVEPEDVRVVVHPQSLVHSLIALNDGAFLAQLGSPDMKVPIRYALTFPFRSDRSTDGAFDLFAADKALWSFAKVDEATFPTLAFARKAWRAGGLMPLVLNAANEAAVNLFLERQIPFTKIFDYVERAFVDFSHMESIVESTFDDMINEHLRVMESVIAYAKVCE